MWIEQKKKRKSANDNQKSCVFYRIQLNLLADNSVGASSTGSFFMHDLLEESHRRRHFLFLQLISFCIRISFHLTYFIYHLIGVYFSSTRHICTHISYTRLSLLPRMFTPYLRIFREKLMIYSLCHMLWVCFVSFYRV